MIPTAGAKDIFVVRKPFECQHAYGDMAFHEESRWLWRRRPQWTCPTCGAHSFVVIRDEDARGDDSQS